MRKLPPVPTAPPRARLPSIPRHEDDPPMRKASMGNLYPSGSDPTELRAVALQHARELEKNVEHHRAHATRLNALEDLGRSLDGSVRELGQNVTNLGHSFQLELAVAKAQVKTLFSVVSIVWAIVVVAVSLAVKFL